MQSGSLHHRGTLQENQPGQDAVGGPTENWVDVATVWAAIEPLHGREFFAARQVQADVTTRIRLRYRPGVKSQMRFVYGSRTYDIQSVIDVDERHVELQLMCTEAVT